MEPTLKEVLFENFLETIERCALELERAATLVRLTKASVIESAALDPTGRAYGRAATSVVDAVKWGAANASTDLVLMYAFNLAIATAAAAEANNHLPTPPSDGEPSEDI